MKTRKGSLEQKKKWWEKSWRLMGGVNRRVKGNNQTASESSISSSTLFRTKIWTLSSKTLPSNSRVYHGGSWRLSNCHIQELKKWIFLKCLIFKEFIFLEKASEMRHLFAWPNYRNKSFEPDHQISSKCPIRRFSNSDHQFFWEP